MNRGDKIRRKGCDPVLLMWDDVTNDWGLGILQSAYEVISQGFRVVGPEVARGAS